METVQPKIDERDTLVQPSRHLEESASKVVVLTVLCHPQVERVGETADLTELLGNEPAPLSRRVPAFKQRQGSDAEGLRALCISRNPLWIHPGADSSLYIRRHESTTRVRIYGCLLKDEQYIPKEDVEDGVVLTFNDQVALLLHSQSNTAASAWPPESPLIGESASMLRVRSQIEQVAASDYPVLILGENGTGKELVAKSLHEASRRKGQPLKTLNMGGIPESLAEAELFGNTKDAFTGAKEKKGYFRHADSGTLFLDEIGACPSSIQDMLLRVLENQEVQRVGGSDQAITIDVRYIAATDRDLNQAMEEKKFKPALFHRLTTHVISLPPLRHRRDDIGRLFWEFLRDEWENVLEKVDGEEPTLPEVPANLIDRLTRFHWPGNVRQLKGVVVDLLTYNLGRGVMTLSPKVQTLLQETPLKPSPKPPRPKPTLDEIREALRTTGGNVQDSAEILGISRDTLNRRIKKHAELQTCLQEARRSKSIRAPRG